MEKSVYKLLVGLERYDTYPAVDALSSVLEELVPVPNSDDANLELGYQASGVLWEEWKQKEGTAAWNSLVAWADQRLTAWHSFKVNALETAWKTDSQAEDLQLILQNILVNLRQGIADNPEILPDAHFIQSLAVQNHSFAFTQALRELRPVLNLPAEDSALTKHCAVCAHSFKYLIKQ